MLTANPKPQEDINLEQLLEGKTITMTIETQILGAHPKKTTIPLATEGVQDDKK